MGFEKKATRKKNHEWPKKDTDYSSSSEKTGDSGRRFRGRFWGNFWPSKGMPSKGISIFSGGRGSSPRFSRRDWSLFLVDDEVDGKFGAPAADVDASDVSCGAAEAATCWSRALMSSRYRSRRMEDGGMAGGKLIAGWWVAWAGCCWMYWMCDGRNAEFGLSWW